MILLIFEVIYGYVWKVVLCMIVEGYGIVCIEDIGKGCLKNW